MHVVLLIVFANALYGLAEPHPLPVPSTLMEAALDALRTRFPNQVVVAFEELWDTRPGDEPHVDLGPPDSSLKQVVDRIRHANPKYKVDFLEEGLVHVYPAKGTADPAGLLDIRLREFFLPPDDCLPQQMINYTGSLSPGFSYTPDLSEYLMRKKVEWNQSHGNPVFGIAGDFMGDCEPSHHRHQPIYHNITVREALNRMAIRSLKVSGETSNEPSWARPKPISWKYRFRGCADFPNLLNIC